MTFESPEEGSAWHFGIVTLLGGLLDRFWLKEGPERGAFYFVLITLARSTKQRLTFVAYVSVGLGLVLTGILTATVYLAHRSLWASITQPDGGLLSIPLIVSFFTLVGMRSAFEFPAELPANWIFQITEEGNGRMCLAGTRKALIAVAIVPAFVVSFAVYAKLWGPISSLLTVLFDIFLCLILTELLLYSSRKIPFTCSHFPGKTNLSLIGALGCLLFAFCAYAMASLEKGLFHESVSCSVRPTSSRPRARRCSTGWVCGPGTARSTSAAGRAVSSSCYSSESRQAGASSASTAIQPTSRWHPSW